MSFNFDDHLERLKSTLQPAHTTKSVADWITTHTYLDGEPFSFKDHEYQHRILQSEAPLLVVQKCSQVGITELIIRRTLALMDIMRSFSVIYTMPTAGFAATAVKTRFDPVVQSSPRLSQLIHTTTDNTEIKRFADNFLYIKGTYGNNQAISVPADMIVHDEFDFSDAQVMSNFQSRLKHSKYKWKALFSTPTVANYGINAEFNSTKRHYNFTKCDHCGHWFVPSYFDHVRIPDFSGVLKQITKENIHQHAWQDAKLHCPKCDSVPNLQVENRIWVCENPDENHEGEGFQVSPFDAPNVVTIPSLILSSTKYDRITDFINFDLGLPATDAESSLQDADIDQMFEKHDQIAPNTTACVIGVDMGVTCHIVVAKVGASTGLHIIDLSTAHYTDLEKHLDTLVRQYRPASIVMDSQPYTDTVHRLQQRHHNLYGSVYVQNKDLEMYKLKDRENNAEKGLLDVRQVNVNRDYAFDCLMTEIRAGKVTCVKNDQHHKLRVHLKDMKRIMVQRTYGQVFAWRKSKEGSDHYHHALLYALIAKELTHTPHTRLIVPVFLGSFKAKNL